jgi:hypothetical protein
LLNVGQISTLVMIDNFISSIHRKKDFLLMSKLAASLSYEKILTQIQTNLVDDLPYYF